MNLTDTHCHIHHLKTEEQRQKAIKYAHEAGITKLINVACDLSERAGCKILTDKNPDIWTTIGIHPTTLNGSFEKNMEEMRKIAKEDKVVAIGEIGLDYYHDKFPHDIQEKYLTAQLNIAKEMNLPAIIHCRAGKNPGENESAFIDLIEILRKIRFSKGVVHCFSGNKTEADRILDLGLHLGFTGIITFPQNEELREIVAKIPLDRMLLETDSPYLPVYEKRGQASEPAFIKDIAMEVAKLKGIDVEDVARMTTGNAERLFGL